MCFRFASRSTNVTSTPGHVVTTSLLRPKKIKDVVRTWYGLVGRGRNVDQDLATLLLRPRYVLATSIKFSTRPCHASCTSLPRPRRLHCVLITS